MKNVRQINQDNVLGVDDEDLSPNDFGPRNGREKTDTDDTQQGVTKKKSTLLPMIGGIVLALGIVGYFGWKIASPYLNHGNASRDAFMPIAAPTAHVNSFDANDQNGPATLSLPPNQMPQNASSGVSMVQTPSAEGPASNLSKSSDSIASIPVVPTNKLAIEKPALQAVSSADDIAQLNKRIDSLGVALNALKDVVDKLQAKQAAVQPGVASISKQVKPVHAAIVVHKSIPLTKKHVPLAVVKESKDDSKKTDMIKSENPSAGGMQLQAVLHDRAWFKSANGETVTVSAGEELKGVGIVQQIDADSGRVIFTNGAVYR